MYYLLLLSIVLAAGFRPSRATAAVVSIPTPQGEYISWNDATGSSFTVENNGANVGSTGKNTVCQFAISNTRQQDYLLTFALGSKQAARMRVTLKSTTTTALDKVVDIPNTGDWTPTEVQTFFLEQLPEGSYTLTFSVSEASGYAGNWGKLAFYGGDALQHVPGTISVASGTYAGGARTENNDDNVGWIVAGSTARYVFFCDEPGVYQMKTPLQRYNQGGTMAIQVEDNNTGQLEVDGSYLIAPDAPTSYVSTTIPMAGEMTTGLKKMTFSFAGGNSYICNYKALTLSKVAQHWAHVSGVAIDGQQVKAGTAPYDWSCDLPRTFSAEQLVLRPAAVHGTISVEARQEGEGGSVEVASLGDGAYSIPTPALNQAVTVIITLTPEAEAVSEKREYRLRIFHIGDIQVERATIDGMDVDGAVLAALNTPDGYAATVTGKTYTQLPVVELTLPDGSRVTPQGGKGQLSGTTATYVFQARMQGMERQYCMTIEGIHIYNKVEGTDQSVHLRYVSTLQNGRTWSNGLYTLTTNDGSFGGWESDTFYFNQNESEEKTYTWQVPSNAVVKQFILRQFHAGYDNATGLEGMLSLVSSPGATVYIPEKHFYAYGDDQAYDLIVNLEGHQAGQPITFRLKGGWRPIASFEFTLERTPYTTAPVLKDSQLKAPTGQNSCVVTFTFDREMQQAEATVAGQTVVAEGGGCRLTFPVWDLDWDATSTLTLTMATDYYGNTLAQPVSIDINVGSRPATEQKVYDRVVSTTAELLQAISTMNSRTDISRKTIFLKNGTYTMPVATTIIKAQNLSLIGQSMDGVILLGTSQEDGHGSAMFKVEGNGLYMQDLTLRTSHWRTGQFYGRVLAIWSTAEKMVMKRVALEGQQDTYLCGHRAYHEDCVICGTVDYIYSGGDNFFQHCDLVIENRGGNVITAPATNEAQRWGMVFNQCTIKAAPNAPLVTNGSYNLGRPWHNEPRTYYLNTTMEVIPSTVGWAGMSEVPTHFYEYNSMNKDGQPLDLSRRGNSPSSTNHYKPVLTDQEALLYTSRRVLCGNDAWDAAALTRQLTAPQQLTITQDGQLQWLSLPNARCYVIQKDGQYLTCTTATSLALDTIQPGATYSVHGVNAMGGMSRAAATVTAPQPTEAREKTPAFPGAEGFGRYVTGGRGGKVYHVTNLNDSGTGSLRWACEQSGTRTIVFDVSGTIHLKSQLKLRNGNVTIAGQTAPGDGICVADWDFVIAAPNVILRYLRFRPGDTSQGEPDGLGGMDGRHIIVDHCSISWSVDECCSVYGNEHMTVQWCIVSQSLRNSTHAKSAHGYGGNWGGKGATYHHNLIAHHDSRTPRFGNRPTYVQQDTTDYRNNVIYNWAGNGCYGGEGMKINMVNNYYKPGPATDGRSAGSRAALAYRICGLGVTSKEGDGSYHIWGKYYVEGNENPDYPLLKQKNWEMGIYPQISADNWGYTATTRDTMRLSQPLPFIRVTTHSPLLAYERVLSHAGASLHRDWVDSVVVSDVRLRRATYTGQGSGNWPGIIDTPYDMKPDDADTNWDPWPQLHATQAPTDTDGDGMPDAWETAHGLDPNDKTDGTLKDQQGYTRLENYLNALVDHITQAQNQDGQPEGYIEYASEDDLTGAISIPTPLLDPDKAEIIIDPTGKQAAKVLNKSFDSFSHGDQALFRLNSRQAGAYRLQLDAATTRSDFKLQLLLTDEATGRHELQHTLSVSNTGDWQKYRTYSLTIPSVSTGLKQLTMTWQSTRGQYTGNVKNISLELDPSSDAIRPVSTATTAAVYDLSGRRLTTTTATLRSGIYIVDGRKIIVR